MTNDGFQLTVESLIDKVETREAVVNRRTRAKTPRAKDVAVLTIRLRTGAIARFL